MLYDGYDDAYSGEYNWLAHMTSVQRIPGMPGGNPQGPPWGAPPSPPYGGGQQPMGAPPSFAPNRPSWQQGSRGIRRCVYRFTYIWLNNGNSFWFYPTFVGYGSVAGFQWRRNKWEYRTINLNRIFSFQCY